MVGIFLVLSCFFDNVKDILEVMGVGAAFLFFSYKLLTGCLFINMDVKIGAERKSVAGSADHLALTVDLKKGGIDSCWVEDIQMRVKEVWFYDQIDEFEKVKFIRPEGMKKYIFYHNESLISEVIWGRSGEKYYVLSPDEEATFSAYTTVSWNTVVIVELIVIGTRPFYNLLLRKRKPIQWKSSIVVLPVNP